MLNCQEGGAQNGAHRPRAGALAVIVGGLAAATLPGSVPARALGLAAVVVVVMAARLASQRPAGAIEVAAAASLVAALALEPGTASAALATPWLGVAVWRAGGAARSWWRAPSVADAVIARLAAWGYLLVGASWALLSRAGVDPAGIGDQLVELTAVHFHYAGFGAAVLLACLAARRSLPLAIRSAVILGPVIVAAGFVGPPLLQAIGTAVMGVGLVGLAAGTLTAGGIASNAPVVARLCLVVSSLSIVAGMALALHFAAAPWLGWTPLSVDLMARSHGILNGAGFVALGVTGRRLEMAG